MNIGIHFDYNKPISTDLKVGSPHEKAFVTMNKNECICAMQTPCISFLQLGVTTHL